MSSRKKKPAVSKKPAANGGGGSPADLESVDSASEHAHEEQPTDDLDAPRQAEAVDDEPSRSERDEAVPAISHINELRPHDEREDAADQESAGAAEYAASSDSDEVAEAIDEAPPSAAPVTRAHVKRVLESLIFVSDTILSVVQLGRLVKAKQAEVRELLAEIMVDYEGRGIELIEVAGGYQFRSAAASAPFVRDMVSQRPVRLTRAQLETLALIAYRQPITRPEIDDVRGVDSGSAIKVLLERDLVKILGRKDEAGRPLLYGTAPYFLEFFSMRTMQDLPTLREFTELNQEHRELFQRKTGEIPDLSSDAEIRPLSAAYVDDDEDGEPRMAADGEAETAVPVSADEHVETRDALLSDEPVSEVQDVAEVADSADSESQDSTAWEDDAAGESAADDAAADSDIAHADTQPDEHEADA